MAGRRADLADAKWRHRIPGGHDAKRRSKPAGGVESRQPVAAHRNLHYGGRSKPRTPRVPHFAPLRARRGGDRDTLVDDGAIGLAFRIVDLAEPGNACLASAVASRITRPATRSRPR